MAFDNADEIVLWVRRSQILQPLNINDGGALPSIRLTGPNNIKWGVLIESGTNVGTFKLTTRDRLNGALEIYDNLVVSPSNSVDFVETRINGISKLPLIVNYRGGGAGIPVNGTYAVAGASSNEVRIEGFRTLPKGSGQHEIMKYTVDRADMLATLSAAQVNNLNNIIDAILAQAQTKLGI